MDVSVLTLTRNRTDHLVEQVHGLLRQTRSPAEHVVAVMGGDDPRPHLPATPWPTRVLDVDPRDDELPLARARNAAAAAAVAPGLVFLDVDCIPSSTLVASYAAALDGLDGVLMGGVRYLPPGAADGRAPDADLHARGDRHPARPEPPTSGIQRTDRYELFWSLSFAVRATTFSDRIGRFDEGYRGYGAEDTDLAFRAREAQVPMGWLADAWAFHQHHETYDPPLQHVEAIIPNARRFREVWGVWPMEGWLRRFADAGLVEWDPDGDLLALRRAPTDDELASAHRATAVPAG